MGREGVCEGEGLGKGGGWWVVRSDHLYTSYMYNV